MDIANGFVAIVLLLVADRPGLTVADDLDANTLSGLFMTRLGRVPEVGDELSEAGFRLVVQAVEEHRVGRVRITRLPAETTATTDTPQPHDEEEGHGR